MRRGPDRSRSGGGPDARQAATWRGESGGGDSPYTIYAAVALYQSARNESLFRDQFAASLQHFSASVLQRFGASALQNLNQRLAEPRRRRRHLDAGRLHPCDLGAGVALAAGDDGTGMAHAAAGRRGAPGDEADHRLPAAALAFVDEELRGVLFGRAADLADHDDRLGRLVRQEHREHVDELGALDRIAADADRRGLAEPFARGLVYRLVGQRSGTRDDADLAGLEDVAGHDADLAFARGHHPGAVRADQAGGGAAEVALDLDHVGHRDALGDGDDQRDLGLDRLADRVGGAGRRHINH